MSLALVSPGGWFAAWIGAGSGNEMLRAAVLGAWALCSSTRAQHAGGSEPSYAQEHAQPWVAAALERFLETPIDLLQWSLARQYVDGTEAVVETEAFRELCFAQLMAIAESDTTDVTEIYGGFADGRFVGYKVPTECTMTSCDTTFLFRAEGDAPAATADWRPWTIESVNEQCPRAVPACTLSREGPVAASDLSVRTVSAILPLPASKHLAKTHSVLTVTVIAPGAHDIVDRSRSTWRAEDVEHLRPTHKRLVQKC